jgi:gluconate 2-dehydrogenase gamma chain
MKFIEDKIIPKSIKEFTSWQYSRRDFVKSTLALSVLSQLALLQSCTNKAESNSILSEKQLDIVITVQNILFPKDKNGPGAINFNAHKYLEWVLADKRIDPDENQYIINGLKWLNETAEEEHSKKFLKLTKKEQVDLIHTISRISWGESWLSVMLTLIIEAMISDPIYGFNTNEIGRKWLEHQAGFPKPTKETMYDTIFKTILNN